MRWLETRIPPPIVMLLLGAAGIGVARLSPALSFESPLNIVAAVVIACAGLALNVLPKVSFRRVGTTANPLRPDRSTHLVTSGVYRFSRNPMYLGHALLLLAWSVYLGNWFAVLVVPIFVFYVSRFQIQPEERLLLARFQDDYAAFCRRTRRWL